MVDAQASSAPLLRARPRRRKERGDVSGAGRRGPVVPAAGMSYVELHSHSAYSFLDGASAPEEMAARAAELGYPALALTDHDGASGAMEFAHACKAFGVRPIVGAELAVTRGTRAFHLTLLVESRAGWRNLCRLITEAHSGTRPRPERDPLPPVLPLTSLEARTEGLVCLSGCARDGGLAAPFELAGGRPAPS